MRLIDLIVDTFLDLRAVLRGRPPAWKLRESFRAGFKAGVASNLDACSDLRCEHAQPGRRTYTIGTPERGWYPIVEHWPTGRRTTSVYADSRHAAEVVRDLLDERAADEPTDEPGSGVPR